MQDVFVRRAPDSKPWNGGRNPDPLAPSVWNMANATPQVEVIWRGTDGAVKSKTLTWRHRPATSEALSDWTEDYFYVLERGYRPPGYERPPLPHCARVTQAGRVLAEWSLSPKRSAESLVTAEPLGPVGIPAAVPNAPSSDHLTARKSSGHTAPPSSGRYYGSPAVNNAGTSNDGGVDQGQPVAKAGHPVESRSRESAR